MMCSDFLAKSRVGNFIKSCILTDSDFLNIKVKRDILGQNETDHSKRFRLEYLFSDQYEKNNAELFMAKIIEKLEKYMVMGLEPTIFI